MSVGLLAPSKSEIHPPQAKGSVPPDASMSDARPGRHLGFCPTNRSEATAARRTQGNSRLLVTGLLYRYNLGTARREECTGPRMWERTRSFHTLPRPLSQHFGLFTNPKALWTPTLGFVWRPQNGGMTDEIISPLVLFPSPEVGGGGTKSSNPLATRWVLWLPATILRWPRSCQSPVISLTSKKTPITLRMPRIFRCVFF